MEVSRHPEMRKLMEEVLACGRSDGFFSKEISLAEEKWVRVNAVTFRNDEEKPVGTILVFHDITELKRLEVVRADFVANVSHELRTPLTAIQGYAETLLGDPPPEDNDAEHFLSIIHRHSQRLGRLIDDLLTLSDLESGRIRWERESLNAEALIGGVLEIFQERAEKNGITLSHSTEPDLPPIFGGADRLQQLLINLIDNAVKYTPPGGRIKIMTSLSRPSEDAEPMVEIAVADTGCGIPEKDLPRLTERFYRVDKARSRELGGTGLGLAIVKHIVQAHGGLLKIESQVQGGTTVRVLLPTAAIQRGRNSLNAETLIRARVIRR
jgi:two-component system phosphate regulon sensor histidine kinase PhoR